MQQQQQYIITTTTAAARRKLQRGSENLFKAKQAAEKGEGKEDKEEEEAVENANSRMHLQSESLAANLHHLDHNEVRQRCRLWATATATATCNWELQSLENRGTEGGRSTRMGSTTTTMSLGQLGSAPLPLFPYPPIVMFI